MKIYVGSGENRFTMSRGSFKYKQKMSGKRQLTLQNKEKTENGYLLTYMDEKNKESYSFKVTQENDKISVDFEGKVPKGVNRFWVTIKTNPNEKLYGCGETYSKFNLKGENVRIWVAEHQNTSRISTKIIKEKHTFYIGNIDIFHFAFIFVQRPVH